MLNELEDLEKPDFDLEKYAEVYFTELFEKNDPSVMPILNKLFETTFRIKLDGRDYTEVFVTGKGQPPPPETGELRYVESGKLLK